MTHAGPNVRAGTIHAIVGENGAKSTLMKTLYGMQEPDSGTISVEGTERCSSLRVTPKGIGGAPALHARRQPHRSRTSFSEANRVVEALSMTHKLAHALKTSCRPSVPTLISICQSANSASASVNALRSSKCCSGRPNSHFDEPTAVLVPEEVDELFVTSAVSSTTGNRDLHFSQT